MNLNEAFQVLNLHIPACPDRDCNCDDCIEITKAREVINDTLDNILNLGNEINLRKASNVLTSYILPCPRDIDCSECSRTEECKEILARLKRLWVILRKELVI